MTFFDDYEKELIAKSKQEVESGIWEKKMQRMRAISQAEKARTKIDASENQEEQDDDDDFDHCPHCDGTGEGRHEGQICPACKGKGY